MEEIGYRYKCVVTISQLNRPNEQACSSKLLYLSAKAADHMALLRILLVQHDDTSAVVSSLIHNESMIAVKTWIQEGANIWVSLASFQYGVASRAG